MGRKLRFTRSASAWRARGARVSAAGTCSRSARASDLRTPMVQHCQNCQTVARTLALERKRPVKNRRCRRCRRCQTPHPKLGNVPTQTVHRMHVPRKHCVYMSSPGEPGHTRRDTHATRAHTGTRMHGSHRRNSQPSQPTNATPTHPHARRPKPPTAAILIQKLAVLGRKFRCSDIPSLRAR